MPIPFKDIPSNIRVPLAYIEFDNSRAQGGAPQRRILVLGQQLATATVPVLERQLVLSEQDAELKHGRGSMLAEMVRFIKGINRETRIDTIALADDVAGVAATGKISVTGPATAAGTLCLYIAGYRIKVAVANGDAATAIATAITAAVNAETRCPVTAAVNGVNLFEVDLTCRWKGESGNHIDLRTNYFEGEKTPAGVGIAFTAMTAGTTNPDVADAIAVMGEDQYNAIIMPYTDAANLMALEAELLDRFGPTRQNDGIAFAAYRGTAAAAITFGDGRNSHLVNCIATGGAAEPPYLWAACTGARAEISLGNDPAAPLFGQELTGLRPPKVADRFTWDERNLLLFAGMSTFTVDAGDRVLIEQMITMYQENSSGFDDTSYLKLNTPATLSLLRYEIRLERSKYQDYKLAKDGNNFAPGQKVMTPTVWRGVMAQLATSWEGRGLIEDAQTFVDGLIIEVNAADPNRLDMLAAPDLVNQFDVLAGSVQFLLN